MFRVKLPYSKSELIRWLLLGSQLDGELTLSGYSGSGDVLTVQTALEYLGCQFRVEGETITIIPAENYKRDGQIYIQDSATGFRMILALLAAIPGGEFLLDASSQLRKRPIQPLVTALRQLGAEIDSSQYPIKIRGKALLGGNVSIDTTISSQYLSALLLIAPLCRDGLRIEISGSRVSWSYVEMTIKVLQQMGIKVLQGDNHIFIEPGRGLVNPGQITVEVDYSSACYFWSMAAISDTAVAVMGARKMSGQADADFADILAEMGAVVDDDNEKTVVSRDRLKGISVDMSQMPDQVPTLAVLGLLADSPTEIYNITHLRFKESDRIGAVLAEIARLGGRADYENDILRIYPLETEPASILVNTYGDHRLVMAFSILKLKYPELRIDNPGTVNKSYPGFWAEYQRFRTLR